MFSDRDLAERVIGKLYQKKKGHFSYTFSTVAILNDQIVGIEIGYDKDQLAKQDLIGGIILFLNSPVSIWWHLITKTRVVIEDYVPKPSENAYYINNIAVSSACRGHGIGKLLLLDVINRANQKGLWVRGVGCDICQ